MKVWYMVNLVREMIDLEVKFEMKQSNTKTLFISRSKWLACAFIHVNDLYIPSASLICNLKWAIVSCMEHIIFTAEEKNPQKY